MTITVRTTLEWVDGPPPAGIPETLLQTSPYGWRSTGPGMVAEGSAITVFLPRGHRSPARPEVLACCIRLLACLEQYRSAAARRAVDDELLPLDLAAMTGHHSDSSGLLAGLKLVDDWKRHGGHSIVLSQQLPVETGGRIHWPRSERAGAPVANALGEVSYRQLSRTRLRVHRTHPLAELHRMTCLGLQHRLSHGEHGPALPNARTAQSILRRHGTQREDRARRVVSWLRAFYQSRTSLTAKDSGISGLIAPRFHPVWEEMLRVALGTAPTQGSWVGRVDANTAHSPIRLVADQILSFTSPRSHLVIDAKDHALDGWPRTGEHTKQWLYRLLLINDLLRSGETIAPDAVGNTFVFPHHDAEPARLRGVVKLDTRVAHYPKLSTIVGIDVNVERVMSAYLSGRVDRELVRAVRKLVGQNGFPGMLPRAPGAASPEQSGEQHLG